MMIIISLASYKERLKYVPRVVDSLLDQTMKADKVILNVARCDEPYIGNHLRDLEKTGHLEIFLADEDLLPHKKYFHTMLRYPEAVVITVDDDNVYKKTLVEGLWKSYQSHPRCVSAYRVHRMHWRGDGTLAPYREWDKAFTALAEPSFELFATGVGGVLYPPGLLGISEANLPEIRECLTADDIYLKWLENKHGVKVVWAPTDKPLGGKKIWWAQHQRRALWRVNKGTNGRNDMYLAKFPLEKNPL